MTSLVCDGVSLMPQLVCDGVSLMAQLVCDGVCLMPQLVCDGVSLMAQLVCDSVSLMAQLVCGTWEKSHSPEVLTIAMLPIHRPCWSWWHPTPAVGMGVGVSPDSLGVLLQCIPDTLASVSHYALISVAAQHPHPHPQMCGPHQSLLYSFAQAANHSTARLHALKLLTQIFNSF